MRRHSRQIKSKPCAAASHVQETRLGPQDVPLAFPRLATEPTGALSYAGFPSLLLLRTYRPTSASSSRYLNGKHCSEPSQTS
jgi:hypothetical protein